MIHELDTQEPGRLGQIDGLRGIAAILIIAFHYFARWTPPHSSVDLYPYGGLLSHFPLFEHGDAALMMFFVISGFVIVMTLDRSQSIGEFAVRRFARIWPALLLCSCITATALLIIPGSPWHPTARDFIPSLTAIDPGILDKMAGTHAFDYIDGAYWTLWVEVRYYVLISLLYFAARKSFKRTLLVVAIVLTAAYAIATVFSLRTFALLLKQILIADFAPWFFIGIGLYFSHKDKVGYLKQPIFYVGIIGLLVQTLVSRRSDLVIAGIFVPAIAVAAMTIPAFSRLLSSRFLRTIGLASISIYLLHQRIGVAFLHWAKMWNWTSPLAGIVMALLIAGFIVILSLMIYRYFEKPMNRWLVDLLLKKRRQCASAGFSGERVDMDPHDFDACGKIGDHGTDDGGGPVNPPRTAVPGELAEGLGRDGLVSIVIPTFNRAYILGEAIESVLSQTYANTEIIVVDDGSTDNTAEVVSRFDPAKVRYLYQQNAGVSAARNLGLRAAQGEFIALLDSDDKWMPWKLEAQVAAMRSFPEIGMVWTDMTAIDAQGEIKHMRYLRQFYGAHRKVRIEDVCRKSFRLADFWPEASPDLAQRPLYIGSIFSQMVLGNLVHTSTTMLRRSRLRQTGLFDTTLHRSGEDYDFHLRTTMWGPVALLDEPGIYYRIGASDQLTGPEYSIDRARNNLATVRRCLKLHAAQIDLPTHVVNARLSDALAWVAQTELEAGDRRTAIQNVWSSLAHKPTARNLILLVMCGLPKPHLWLNLARSLKKRAAALRSAKPNWRAAAPQHDNAAASSPTNVLVEVEGATQTARPAEPLA